MILFFPLGKVVKELTIIFFCDAILKPFSVKCLCLGIDLFSVLCIQEF